MKIVFRLNYHTRPGQSLWIDVATYMGEAEVWESQELPMQWVNPEQWEAELEVNAKQLLSIKYAYQFREESNDMRLNEWGKPRELKVDPSETKVLFLRDDWRSASTVDYAYETMAIRPTLPARLVCDSGEDLEDQGTHELRLNMAAVPEGFAPCVMGDVDALGSWQRDRALPMIEYKADQWVLRLTVPSNVPIEYKYGLYDLKRGSAPELEVGENRQLEAHDLGDAQYTIIQDEAYRRDPTSLYRAAGVAVPVFSLRSEKSLGVGEFADLLSLADWARGVGLKLIQILPVNDTTSSHDWTDSYPYSAISVFALHPIYLRLQDIDLKMPKNWVQELDVVREELNQLDQVNHEQVMAAKHKLTHHMYQKHGQAIRKDGEFKEFLTENKDWLVPYAAFCVKRDHYKTADFSKWSDGAVFEQSAVDAMMDEAHSDYDAMHYHIWLQHELDRQLKSVAGLMREQGIALKGDLPIGIDRQSADAWSAPQLFYMDSQAGAPPDAFSKKGQNWGFPTYNWEAMRNDDYAWWCARFDHLSRYFDAFRIDHILGFFRIWQVPVDQVEGIMGWFDPALPVRIEEFAENGIEFDRERFCKPFITDDILKERFGDAMDEVLANYLEPTENGRYQLREAFSTQRKVVDHFSGMRVDAAGAKERSARICQGLLDCISDVLFFEDPSSGCVCFHPRFFIQKTHSFAALDAKTQERVDQLYVDYFFLRQDGFWKAQGVEKLPAMRRASEMLLCGEDLGMVPDCVPGVMHELGILSLEIQRMPKTSNAEFSDPRNSPYMSVVSPSTHDMSTLREWWIEDRRVTERFAWYQLQEAHPPAEMTGAMVERIICQHLESPAMWAVFPLQDLLAMDEDLRHPDFAAERINVPAIMPYNWRYRMHLQLEELAAADGLNHRIASIIDQSGR